MSMIAARACPHFSAHLPAVAAVAALALLATPVHAQGASPAKPGSASLERRTAQIQGSIEDECPPAGAVTVPVPSAMAAPLDYSNPVVTTGKSSDPSSSLPNAKTPAKGVARKGTPREIDCPAPIVTYVAEAPALPVEEFVLPLSVPAVASAAGAPLWLAGLPLAALPFLGGGGGSDSSAVLPPISSPPITPPPPPVVPPIPEPATWLTMILGFFAVGIAIRRTRSRREPMAVLTC